MKRTFFFLKSSNKLKIKEPGKNLIEILMNSPRKLLRLGLTEACGLIDNIDEFKIKKFDAACATGNKGIYVPTTLLNAINGMKKIHVVERGFDEMNAHIQYDKLASYRSVIHGPGEKLQLQKVRKGSKDPFEGLMQ